eukprot:Stramenopile-MAST_4_protein_3035
MNHSPQRLATVSNPSLADSDTVTYQTNYNSAGVIDRAIAKFREGLYGVLYIMGSDTRTSYFLFTMTTVIEMMQLLQFTFSLTERFNWPFPWLANIFSFTNFSVSIVSIPVATYFSVLHAAMVIITLAFANAVFVGYSFANNQYKVMFLLQLLRFSARLAIGVLYMPATTILMSVFICEGGMWNGVACWSGTHSFYTISCGTMLFCYVAFTAITALAFIDRSPISKSPNAMAHGRVSAAVMLIKFMLEFIYAVEGSDDIQWMLYATVFGSGCILVGVHLYYLPYYSMLSNKTVVAIFSVYLWSGVCICADFIFGSNSNVFVLFIVALPFFCYCMVALVHWRFKNLCKTLKLDAKFGATYNGAAISPYLIEVRLRQLLEDIDKSKWKNDIAEQYCEFCARYTNKPFMMLHISTLYTVVGENNHMGTFYANQAASRSPDFDIKFILYQMRRRVEETSANLASEDAMNFVAFDNHMQQARKYTTKARTWQLSFWDSLVSREISNKVIISIGANSYRSATQAQSHYESLMRITGSSIKVMRTYAGFLADVMNNVERAEKLLSRANELEDAATKSRSEAFESQMQQDEEFNAVVTDVKNKRMGLSDLDGVVVIAGGRDRLGMILKINAVACRIFGVKREAVVKKCKINDLIPSPFSQLHDSFIDRYLQTGEKKVIDTCRMLFALNAKTGYISPIFLTVREFTSSKGEFQFVGTVKETPSKHDYILGNADTGRVYGISAGCATLFPRYDLYNYVAESMSLEDFFPGFDSPSTKVQIVSKRGMVIDVENEAHKLNVKSRSMKIMGLNISVLKIAKTAVNNALDGGDSSRGPMSAISSDEIGNAAVEPVVKTLPVVREQEEEDAGTTERNVLGGTVLLAGDRSRVGLILKVDEQICQLLGVSRNNVVNKRKINHFFPSPYNELNEAFIRTFTTSKIEFHGINSVFVLNAKTGFICPVQLTIEECNSGKGEPQYAGTIKQTLSKDDFILGNTDTGKVYRVSAGCASMFPGHNLYNYVPGSLSFEDLIPGFNSSSQRMQIFDQENGVTIDGLNLGRPVHMSLESRSIGSKTSSLIIIKRVANDIEDQATMKNSTSKKSSKYAINVYEENNDEAVLRTPTDKDTEEISDKHVVRTLTMESDTPDEEEKPSRDNPSVTSSSASSASRYKKLQQWIHAKNSSSVSTLRALRKYLKLLIYASLSHWLIEIVLYEIFREFSKRMASAVYDSHQRSHAVLDICYAALAKQSGTLSSDMYARLENSIDSLVTLNTGLHKDAPLMLDVDAVELNKVPTLIVSSTANETVSYFRAMNLFIGHAKELLVNSTCDISCEFIIKNGPNSVFNRSSAASALYFKNVLTSQYNAHIASIVLTSVVILLPAVLSMIMVLGPSLRQVRAMQDRVVQLFAKIPLDTAAKIRDDVREKLEADQENEEMHVGSETTRNSGTHDDTSKYSRSNSSSKFSLLYIALIGYIGGYAFVQDRQIIELSSTVAAIHESGRILSQVGITRYYASANRRTESATHGLRVRTLGHKLIEGDPSIGLISVDDSIQDDLTYHILMENGCNTATVPCPRELQYGLDHAVQIFELASRNISKASSRELVLSLGSPNALGSALNHYAGVNLALYNVKMADFTSLLWGATISLVICVYIVVTCVFFPLIHRIDLEVTYTRSLLLMVPTAVLRMIPGVGKIID